MESRRAQGYGKGEVESDVRGRTVFFLLERYLHDKLSSYHADAGMILADVSRGLNELQNVALKARLHVIFTFSRRSLPVAMT